MKAIETTRIFYADFFVNVDIGLTFGNHQAPAIHFQRFNPVITSGQRYLPSILDLHRLDAKFPGIISQSQFATVFNLYFLKMGL
ncbi:hypothetical protein B6S08_03850 [Oceanimonas doudoroffii]|uniref:Uncharacterized protein n=1 Tax=Oceanimonas doudoroffii TaxID=84158 RepID=A0A233RGZ2_9GAMM|nr:hypothetical protein B6S08_03850 [Oceanimonas doudoroffii]